MDAPVIGHVVCWVHSTIQLHEFPLGVTMSRRGCEVTTDTWDSLGCGPQGDGMVTSIIATAPKPPGGAQAWRGPWDCCIAMQQRMSTSLRSSRTCLQRALGKA